MILTQEEIERQLLEIKDNKAVAPNSIPVVSVKALAGPLATWIHQFRDQKWRTNPQIPQCWKDASLTLLPKRQVKQPTDLCPIALTELVGKAILGGYTKRAKAAMLPTLVTMPLLVRGVAEALVTVFDFCADIREQCAKHAASPC